MVNVMTDPKSFTICGVSWENLPSYKGVKEAILKSTPNGITLEDGKVPFVLNGKKYTVRRRSECVEGVWVNGDCVIIEIDYRHLRRKCEDVLRKSNHQTIMNVAKLLNIN